MDATELIERAEPNRPTLKERLQRARLLVANLNTHIRGHSRQSARRIDVALPKNQRNLTVHRTDGSVKRTHDEEVARQATKKLHDKAARE